jgi:rRNA-processing protein FCF1
MRAVIDSSSWISLARAGLLYVLRSVPVEPILLDVVHAEIVGEGRRGGYADAAALTAAVAAIPVVPTQSRQGQGDSAVLNAAEAVGVLVANDLALGRRARSLGVAWIRTADLIILAVHTRSMSSSAGIEALTALEGCGRITREMADAYRDQLQ